MRKKSQLKTYYFSEKLKKKLSRITEYPLTIVEAPSGFGKTTAVREYLKLSENTRQYWYTCLGESTSLAWQGICDLLSNVNMVTAVKLKKLKMPVPDTLPYIVEAVKELQCMVQTFLIIDNYQLMKCHIPRELVNVFSMHGCPCLHIIFITQQLTREQRFTLHGVNIHKMGYSDFYFDREGTDRLFSLEGIHLSQQELERVYRSTDGWIAAIKLQIINYQEDGLFHNTLEIEYLVETAIWNHLRNEERDFLISVSVLESFSAYQAAIMIGKEGLPQNVEELLHSSDFIRYYPDKGIYVIHSILQEFLKKRFYHYRSKNFQTRVLRRAGASFVAVQEYCPAAVLFSREKDFDSLLAMPLTGEHITDQKENYRPEWIEILIDSCPIDTLIQYPFKLLVYAYQMLLLKKYEPYGKLCRLIAMSICRNEILSKKEVRILRGEFALLKACTIFNDLEKRIKKLKYAWKVLGRPSMVLTQNSSWPCGISILYLFWCRSGELEKILVQIAESSQFYRKLTGGHMIGAESVMQAEAMLLRGKVEEAEILCYKALYDARRCHQVGICLCAGQVLARVAILRGDVKGYFTEIKNIKNHKKDNSKLHIFRTAELCLASINLILGIGDDIPDWLCSMESIEKVLYPHAVSSARIVYAKKLLLENRYNELYGFSEFLIEQCENMLMPQLYNLIFLTIAKLHSGKKQEAQEYLKKALAIALPDKVYLPFAEHMKELGTLIEDIRQYISSRPQLLEFLAVCRQQERGSSIIRKSVWSHKSSLTPREREIALLAKDRLSAREIADKLYISDTTVRTILKNVYSKLDIHSKKELNTINF